jgi:hypothetical protein
VPGNTLKKELHVPGRRELYRFVQGKNARIGFNEPFSRLTKKYNLQGGQHAQVLKTHSRINIASRSSCLQQC